MSLLGNNCPAFPATRTYVFDGQSLLSQRMLDGIVRSTREHILTTLYLVWSENHVHLPNANRHRPIPAVLDPTSYSKQFRSTIYQV
jgi:hypothetical protein